MIRALIAVLLLMTLVSCSWQEAVRENAMQVLHTQRDAWNRADIDGYLDGYARSANLTFLSAEGKLRGFDELKKRYEKKYPDATTMGQLTFTDIEVVPLSSDAAVVFGCWRLIREKDSPNGLFTVAIRKLPYGWKVVHDHTSLYPALSQSETVEKGESNKP